MTTFPWTDSITVLRARPGIRLAKQIALDGMCRDFDNPKHFSAVSTPLSGLHGLADVLARLLPQHDACVVRGEPVPGANREYMRRLAIRDAETGDAPTLADVPRRWLLLDADGIPRPEHIPAHDLLACADLALELLPTPFQRAACVVVASANHGIKQGCRLRLGFWCDRPMMGRELNRWLQGAPLDMSVFRPAQIIYTSAPIFTGGRRDHLPSRIVEYPGEDWLQCPAPKELAEPVRETPSRPEHIAIGAQAHGYIRAALTKAADAILTAKEGKRHETICMEARSLARLVKAGMLAASDMRAVLSRAAEGAGKDDPGEIESCINWGLNNPSDGALPEARHAA